MKLKFCILLCALFQIYNIEAQAYDCHYQENLTDEEYSILFEGVNEGQKSVEEVEIKPFAFLIRNSDHQIVGGINGASFHDYISIEMLWVSSELRHKGWGTRLMNEAEELGRERNCRFATLTTGTKEALSFYQKCGYEIEYSKPGYEKNSRIYMLKKNLE